MPKSNKNSTKKSPAEKPISLYGEGDEKVPFEDILEGLLETPPLPNKKDKKDKKKPAD